MVGKSFLSRLGELLNFPTVGDVRGLGLMLAIEFVKDKKTKDPIIPFDPYFMEIQKQCRNNGLFVRIQANKMIFSPPLIFTKQHVDEVVDTLSSILSEIRYS